MLKEIIVDLQNIDLQIDNMRTELKTVKIQNKKLKETNTELEDKILQISKKKESSENSLQKSIDVMNFTILEMLKTISDIYNYSIDLESLDKLREKISQRISRLSEELEGNRFLDPIRLVNYPRNVKPEVPIHTVGEEKTGDKRLDGTIKKCKQFKLSSNVPYLCDIYEEAIAYRYDIEKDDSCLKTTITLNKEPIHKNSEQIIIEKGTAYKLTKLIDETGKQEFIGWSYRKDGEKIESDNIEVEEDVMLYSLWKPYKRTSVSVNSFTENKIQSEIKSNFNNTSNLQPNINGCEIKFDDNFQITSNSVSLHNGMTIACDQPIIIRDINWYDNPIFLNETAIHSESMSISVTKNDKITDYKMVFENLNNVTLEEIKNNITKKMILKKSALVLEDVKCVQSAACTIINAIYRKKDKSRKVKIIYSPNNPKNTEKIIQDDQVFIPSTIGKNLFAPGKYRVFIRWDIKESENKDLTYTAIYEEYTSEEDAIKSAIELGYTSPYAIQKNTGLNKEHIKNVLKEMENKGIIKGTKNGIGISYKIIC